MSSVFARLPYLSAAARSAASRPAGRGRVGVGLFRPVTPLARGGRLISTLVALLAGSQLLIGGRLVGARRLSLVALLAGAHVLIGGRLHSIAALAGGGRLVSTLGALLPGRAGDLQRRLGLDVDAPAGLQALLLLERNERLPGARTELAIRLADKEPLLLEDDLHLADLFHAETHCALRAASV
jgi:hypothetical protein